MIRLIRSLYYILFFLTPLLIFSQTSELFEFNKMIFIYLITTLIFFFWILIKLNTGGPIIKKNLLFIPFLFFLLTQLISTVFSIDFHTSIFGYYGRFNGGVLSIIAYLTLFYIFIDQFSFSFLNRLLKLSLISSFITILWGIPGRFGYDLSCLLFTKELNNNCWTDQFRPAERMFSTLGQPNWLGAFLAINFFIGLYFYYRTTSPPNFVIPSESATWRRNRGIPLFQSFKGFLHFGRNDNISFIYLLYLVFNFSAVLLTRSDSSFLAVFIGVLLLFILLFSINRDIVISIIKKTVILFVVFIILLFSFKTGNSKIDRFLNMTFSNKTIYTPISPPNQPPIKVTDSFDIRKIVWKGAIELGKRYPLFGTGVETFAYGYYFTRPAEHNLTSEWDYLYNKAHNEFLNYFATTGILGLSSYIIMIVIVIGLFVYNLINKEKIGRELSLQAIPSNHKLLITCLFCSYISILVTNFFGFSISVVNLYFYIFPAILIALMMNPLKSKLSGTYGVWTKRIGKGLILAFFFFTIVFLIRYYIADIKYSYADSSYREGDYKNSSSLLNEALGLHYEHVYEDKLSYNLANLSYLAYYQDATETAKTLIKLSDAYNLKSLNASPKNVNYWKTRAKNYYLYFQTNLDKTYLEKGVDSLKIAQKLSPTDPKIPYSLALYYSLIEDEIKDQTKKKEYQILSIESVNQSIELKPDYEDGYLLKAQLLKKAGDKDNARSVLEKLLKEINPYSEEATKEMEKL